MDNIVRLVVCVAIGGLSACGDVTEVPAVALPVAAPGEFSAVYEQRMAGELEVDDRGCWYLDAQYGRGLLIFPPGFTPPDFTPAGFDPTDAGAAQAVDIVGTIIHDTALLPGGPDGTWAGYAASCGTTDGVVVASEFVEPAPPTRGAAAALVADLTPTSLVSDWPCGYGFATSTADQRVGVTITPIGEPPPVGGTVTLPDDHFEARVTVGSNLFANHCDDIVEWFEPRPVAVAQFPLVSGSFTYPEPSACTGGSTVITLTDAVVALPTGEVSLGPIEIVNEALGCFAG